MLHCSCLTFDPQLEPHNCGANKESANKRRPEPKERRHPFVRACTAEEEAATAVWRERSPTLRALKKHANPNAADGVNN